MESIYKNLGAVIGFSVIVLLVQNFISEKAGEYTVLLTLVTMLLVNVGKFTDFASNFGKGNRIDNLPPTATTPGGHEHSQSGGKF